jgi:hypothetical protein
MSYGSASGVAALAKTWTDAGEFIDPDIYGDGATPTTLTEVGEWLDQVSSFMDISFADQGFTVPIVETDVLKAIDLKVNALVADLVHLAHGKGRLFSDRIQNSGQDAMSIIEKELLRWVSERIASFEAYGIPRSINLDDTQAYSAPMSRHR